MLIIKINNFTTPFSLQPESDSVYDITSNKKPFELKSSKRRGTLPLAFNYR